MTSADQTRAKWSLSMGPHFGFDANCSYRFALRCWLCSASADFVMGRVYGALLVAMLVVC